MAEHPLTQPTDWLACHGDALYAFALRRVSDPAAAEDLVQETLLAAWRAREGFHGAATERTWLIGILKHKCADELRRRQRRIHQCGGHADDIEAAVFRRNGRWAEPPGDWGRDPLRAVEAEALSAALGRCVDRLPDTQRAAFLLKEVDGLHSDEATTRLGVTRNHLHVLMHRTRLHLRRCLERTGLVKGDQS